MNRRSTSFPRALTLALGAVVFVFALSAVIEHTAFHSADLYEIRLLHAARGIGSSILAAVTVAWALLRATPLPGTAPGAEASDAFDVESPEPHARWLIRMRWVAGLVMALLVASGSMLPGILAPGALAPLAGIVLATAATNLAHIALANRRRNWVGILLVQVLGDLLLLTLLLHWSGGVENPLAAVMILHVVIAGVVLPSRLCFVVAANAIALSAGLVWSEALGFVPHHPLGLFGFGRARSIAFDPAYVGAWSATSAAVLVGVAQFATSLSESRRRARKHLVTMAESALAQRQLLERALDTAGTGLRLLDANQRTTFESSLWRGWFSGSARPTVSPAVLRVFEDRSVRVTETSLPEPDPARPGRTRARSFEITTAPVLGTDGEVRQVAELAKDVTDAKRTQAEMLRTGKMVAVGELAAVVAHEINNPIAILGAKAQLLLTSHHQDMSPKVAQEVQKIVDLSERVASIAQGLLSACRPARGARKRMDLRVPVRRVLGMIQPEREKCGIDLEDQLGDYELPVFGNSSEMEQVFLNLLLNATHAMGAGGKLSLAQVEAGAEGTLGIYVEDTGAGIPREYLERVWEPFFSTKSEGHGTGLGLAVCLSVIQSHGGTIEIDSEEGMGTRVTVRLPKAVERTEEAERAEAPHLGG